MRFFLARFVQMLFVLWAVATIMFLIFRLMPGNPVAAYIDTTFTEEMEQAILAQFGLDKPLWQQYLVYMGNLLQGEFGMSFQYRQPVSEVLAEVFPNSIILTLTSLIIAYIIGIMAGAFLAWKRGTWIEGVGIPLVLTTRAAPEFWLGMVFLALFAFQLGWFPAGGANSAGMIFETPGARYFSWDFLHHLMLPAFTLSVYLLGLPLLLMRSNMLEVMQEEFVTMARMKGLSEWTIMLRHAARNALLPVATAFALGVGGAIGGNVVVETVFSWPGIGRMLVNAVAASDYPLAQGAFLIITAVLVVMNFTADLLYTILDPRVSRVRRS